MRVDPNNEKHIIADDGKVLIRKSDDLIYGKEIYLGYTWYIGNVKLTEPHLETVEDFDEIDEPNNDDNI